MIRARSAASKSSRPQPGAARYPKREITSRKVRSPMGIRARSSVKL